jgi:hypothetical protein
MNARDIRALLHDSEFQRISDRNSQMLFLRQFALDECSLSINNKALARVFEISEGNVRKIRCLARQRDDDTTGRPGRPPLMTDDQEAAMVEGLIARASQRIFLTTGELLNEVEQMFGKLLTYGWVNRFLTRHRDQLEAGTVDPQEDPRLEIPRVFLNQYLDLMSEQIVGLSTSIFSLGIPQSKLRLTLNQHRKHTH